MSAHIRQEQTMGHATRAGGATGTIFDIQRFSIHDGPGIRTTVFFKGCNLRCFWCHNPESLHPGPQLQFFAERCIACGACVTICQHGASFFDDGAPVYDARRCAVCGACAEVCYAEARVLVGRRVTADQVVEEILRDRAFYDSSGGGVTLSGGEPVLQRAFAGAILARCRAGGLHTALETAGHYPWEHIAALLPLLDLIMMDIKHLESDRHRAATGAPNERILANARRLAETDRPLIFRVPVIPTVNDTEQEIGAIADFVQGLADGRHARRERAPITLELLAFHRLAGDKYRGLGLDCRASALEPLSAQRMAELTELAQRRGPQATEG